MSQVKFPHLPITGTFLDEITHDIPSQNWGFSDWDRDFHAMKLFGIDTVILIRSGYKRWLTYPSEVLIKKESCYRPPIDLLDMFLTLSEKYNFSFYFGTYDSGHYWQEGRYHQEINLNLAVIEEVWNEYGHRKSFKGWYLTQEVSRRTKGIIQLYASLGNHCKDVSDEKLPILISPWMDGIKSVSSHSSKTTKGTGITIIEHEKEWNEIMDGISSSVDIVAFQDGHVDYHELLDYLTLNKMLADKFGLRSWTNSESFDRDMPIKFLPIDWRKLHLKLQAAGNVGVEKAITFEFSHFLSPNSCYSQARNLYKRYMEFFDN